MTITRICGDIHGNFDVLQNIIKDCDNSIQVGDYGIGFGHNPPMFGKNHRFIRGNHDNIDECIKYENFIKDGTVEDTIHGPMMFIGGAWSIDKACRTPGLDWWDTEENSSSELNDLINKYEFYKPEIMITHTLPFSVILRLFPSFNTGSGDRTSQALQAMLEIHQPKLHIAGHWHPYKTISAKIGKTDYFCLGINSWIDADL